MSLRNADGIVNRYDLNWTESVTRRNVVSIRSGIRRPVCEERAGQDEGRGSVLRSFRRTDIAGKSGA